MQRLNRRGAENAEIREEKFILNCQVAKRNRDKNRVTQSGGERVNICQTIWSVLAVVDVNFVREKWKSKVVERLENGLPTNLK